MFRLKDKYGLYIYTCKKPPNGMEYAMCDDRYFNDYKPEIITDADFETIYKIGCSRQQQKIYYHCNSRRMLNIEFLAQCQELRYCYTFKNFVLVIRKQPHVDSKLNVTETFIGFYFIKR